MPPWTEIREECLRQIDTYLLHIRQMRDNGRNAQFIEYKVTKVRIPETKRDSASFGNIIQRIIGVQKQESLKCSVSYSGRKRIRRDDINSMDIVWNNRVLEVVVIGVSESSNEIEIATTNSIDINILKESSKSTRNDLKIRIDLEWLTRSLKDFYSQEDLDLRLPTLPLNIKARYIDGSNDSQKHAVDMVLSSPMCYIQGAPGTGKTTYAIAGAVNSFMHWNRRAGKTLLIVAPTNIALARAVEDLETKLPDLKGRILIYGPKSADQIQENNGIYIIRAATLDTFRLRWEEIQNSNIVQVLYDEACYGSVIKSIPLLALSCPIAFFGDHKQLEPVCEVNNNSDRSRVEYFWRKSISIYAIFSGGNIDSCFLNTSYRYGQDLATMLQKFFYEECNSFIGTGNTQIFYHHIAEHVSSMGDNRFSIEEINTAYDIAKQLRCNDKNESIGILFLYKAPVKIFNGLHPDFENINNNYILNTHKAQGQEYDTVIFCVTDTPAIKHYSTSKRKDSKPILNTTISRVKRRLIVLCNDGWRMENDEFITELLQIAKPWHHDRQ